MSTVLFKQYDPVVLKKLQGGTNTDVERCT